MDRKFGFSVEYAQHSSALGSANTWQEAIDGALYHIVYYKLLDYPIRNAEAHELCAACEGYGEIIKRTKTGLVKSRKPCRPCKGTGKLFVQVIAN